MDYADLVYSYTGHDVISNFWSAFLKFEKTSENAASDGFRSNLSGVTFCLPHQSVRFLFKLKKSFGSFSCLEFVKMKRQCDITVCSYCRKCALKLKSVKCHKFNNTI